MNKRAVVRWISPALGVFCGFSFCALAKAQGGSAPGQSEPEQAMVRSVDGQAAAGQELLQQLVELNSGTMNLEGVRAVRAMLAPRFEALGFKTTLVPMDAVHRAGHLIAEHPCPRPAPGACGKRMLLIGHMDTVFEKDSPFQHWSVDGDTATGPGSNDMKGGLVIMLMALQAMKDAGVLASTAITVVLTGDEENHGLPATISRGDLIAAAHRTDLALEFEGLPRMGGTYYGSISRRSASSWAVQATGKTGHSSGIFSDSAGDGAVYELVRILNAFRVELPEKYLTYNVGLVGGGSMLVPAGPSSVTVSGKTNIIPPVATARGDIRTVSDEQTARTQTKMREIVARHLPGTGAEITFEEGYPAMPPTDASRKLLGELNAVNRSLGVAEMPELDPLQRGAGDIAFVAPYLPGLAGVGATGLGAHAPGETVDLPSQVLNAKRDALLMYRLSLEK